MNHIYQLVTPVVVPEITQEYGLLTAEILLWSFVLSYSLLPAVSGYLSRFLSRRILLTAGFTTTALSFLAVGLTGNVTLLAVLFFISGVGGSTYHPFGSPTLAEANPTSRGQTLGLHQTGGAIGSIAGPFITGILVYALGWRPAVMLLAVPGFLLAVMLSRSIRTEQLSEESTQPEKSKFRFRDLKAYVPSMIFIVAAFIYVFGLRGMDNIANEYFRIGRGIGIIEASLLFSMLKVAGLFSAPICGRLSDKFGRKTVLITLVFVESLSLFAITFSPDWLLVVPCIAFGFASFGLLAVGEALLVDVTPEKWRPTIFGINLTVSFSPQIFLVPLLFGLAETASFASGLLLLSALMPLSIPLLLVIKTKPPWR